MTRSETVQRSQEHETHRVIIPRQNGEGIELLLVPCRTGLLLPWVEIPLWQRVAETLTAAVHKAWGYDVVCLFQPTRTPDPDSNASIRYAVLECCGLPTPEHAARSCWLPISSLSANSFADPADWATVGQSLAQRHAYLSGAVPGPFATPGWFQPLRQWIKDAIGPLGLEPTGAFRQFNAGPWFCLMRFETNGPAVWFKAVGEPNLRELPVMLVLARLLPSYVPPILATRPECNGWLVPEIEGMNLAENCGLEHWKTAAARLAQLQIDSIGKHAELLSAGAHDLRTSPLSGAVHPFLAAMVELMRLQTKTPPPILTTAEILHLAAPLKAALARMEKLAVPDTLGHLDLNPNNLIVADNACTFLDWAEAYVGNPFFSFEYLRLHFRRMAGPDVAAENQLTAAYAQPWQALLKGEVLACALEATALLAAFAYACAGGRWRDPEIIQSPDSAGYLRSLTRRLYREANQLRDRRAWAS